MDTYQTDHESLQGKVAKAQQEASDAQTWFRFIEQHREVVPNDANRLLVLEYFNGDPLSLAGLDEAFSNPTFTARIVFQSEGDERKRLLAELKEVFSGPDDNWRSELLATRYLTNPQIAAKIATLRSKHEMQKLSTGELRQVIKDGRPAPVTEELPATYTRRVLVKELSPLDLRRVIDRYGRDAVNRRIAGITV